jgi:phage portal protein BeeE
MFDKPEQARAIFEPYVKHLQSAIEAALNSQLMPQLESGNARFSFRQINVNDSFTKAKTDMIYLSEGVLSPSEVRLERGLDPEGIVEQQPTAVNANISGGKNQDKSEESERVENRNLTGDREQ